MCICMYICVYLYIYIYTCTYIRQDWNSAPQAGHPREHHRRRARNAANLRTKILDFRGFDSSRILILRGGILMSIGNISEIMIQAILVGIILVGRLGVPW